jgi:two-component system phosphate regulon response regulator PhoB
VAAQRKKIFATVHKLLINSILIDSYKAFWYKKLNSLIKRISMHTQENNSTFKKVLLVEDEQDIRDLITIQLESQGLKVKPFSHGDEALSEIQTKNDYDLYIIDWMLPGTSGIDLCKAIRKQNQTKDSPILMVTALTQSENIIAGLDAGADDYVTKPFDMNVFQARVRAQIRRKREGASSKIENGILKIDTNKCRVLVNDAEVTLTSTEFKILSILASTPGHVFTREQLIGQIQGSQVHVTNRTVDTHVAGLRKKLQDASKYIETIRGIGYRFTDNE